MTPHLPDRLIEYLPLSYRLRQCLHHAGIETVGQVLALTPSDLLKIRNVGPKSLAALRVVLRAHHSDLKQPDLKGHIMPRPDNDLPRREKAEETRRDWEPFQVDADSSTDRLRIGGGWLYRCWIKGTAVGLVFVPATADVSDDETA